MNKIDLEHSLELSQKMFDILHGENAAEASLALAILLADVIVSNHETDRADKLFNAHDTMLLGRMALDIVANFVNLSVKYQFDYRAEMNKVYRRMDMPSIPYPAIELE